jgi:hypothetical protein
VTQGEVERLVVGIEESLIEQEDAITRVDVVPVGLAETLGSARDEWPGPNSLTSSSGWRPAEPCRWRSIPTSPLRRRQKFLTIRHPIVEAILAFYGSNEGRLHPAAYVRLPPDQGQGA